jgi:hypothetical protein
MNSTPTKSHRWRPITVFNLLVGLLFSLSALGQQTANPQLLSTLIFSQITELDSTTLVGVGKTGVYLSANGGEQWNPITFPSQGRPGTWVGLGVLYTNSTLYIGTLDDGFYISKDKGLTWTSTGPVNNSFGTGSGVIAFNGKAVVCGYGGWPRGVYRLNSEGTGWIKTFSGYDGIGCVVAPSGRFLMTIFNNTGGAVLKSDDDGSTWQNHLSQMHRLTVDGESIYAISMVDYSIKKSLDNGDNWLPFGKSPPVKTIYGGISDFIRFNGVFYASIAESGVWESSNGEQWNQVFTNSGSIRLSMVQSGVMMCSDNGLYLISNKNKSSIATATAQVVNGFVVAATITNGGSGYTNNPTVTFTGGGGNGAKATANQINGTVASITIINPGSGYTSAPTITIAPPPFPPRKATGTSQVVNGFVVGTKITDAGFGYDAPPSVLLVGGGGTGATATATVQNGVVTAITITNPGTGYTSAPLIRIASPPFRPKLAIEVSKVNVRLSVVLGRKYQIESSSDLTNWKPASAVFIAQDEELVQEFDVNTTGNYYRINQVP